MTPSARVQTTIEVLDIIKSRNLPMDLMVGDYMRTRRYIGSKDRRNVVERIYDIVRHHARVEWWLEKQKAEDTVRNRVLAYLALHEIKVAAQITELFSGQKYAPTVLEDAEKKLIKALCGQSINDNAMSDAVATETPPLYADKLQAKFGDRFTEFCL